jgi:hypothetical protein
MSSGPIEVDHPFKPELSRVPNGVHLRRLAHDVLDFTVAAEYRSFDTADYQARIELRRDGIGREAG